MGTLAFFPWLRLDRAYESEAFRLVPYRRGVPPNGAAAELYRGFDTILEPYMAAPKASVRNCTLIVPAGKEPGDELSEVEGQALFVFAELVAFCGLCERDFFGFQYWNRDNFRLVIQHYSEPSASTSYQIRRRDGSNTVLASSHLVLKPEHVGSSTPVKLDEALLHVLGKTTDVTNWDQIYESILHFNTANTDSHAFTEAMELVLIVSAFERLIGTQSGKCRPLAEGVADAMDSFIDDRRRVANGDSARVPSDVWDTRFKKSPSLTHVWMSDLCALRGTVAHGGAADRYPYLWTPREHLLLASAIFPPLMRAFLGTPSPDSARAAVWVFELLLETDLFPNLRPGATGNAFPWNRVMRKEWHRKRMKELVDKWWPCGGGDDES